MAKKPAPPTPDRRGRNGRFVRSTSASGVFAAKPSAPKPTPRVRVDVDAPRPAKPDAPQSEG